MIGHGRVPPPIVPVNVPTNRVPMPIPRSGEQQDANITSLPTRRAVYGPRRGYEAPYPSMQRGGSCTYNSAFPPVPINPLSQSMT
jgi:hypothetical protein